MITQVNWVHCVLFLPEETLIISGFFKGVLGTRFGSLELKIGFLETEKVIIRSLESEKIWSLESEKSGPYRSIPGT